MLTSRPLCSGPSAMLKTAVMAVLLLGGGAVVRAQTPDVSAGHASTPAVAPVSATPPGADSGQVGYHDLICKPNGTEDGFDCADEATPAKIVPIPSQVVGPRAEDRVVWG
jgi:hypothetical protein